MKKSRPQSHHIYILRGDNNCKERQRRLGLFVTAHYRSSNTLVAHLPLLWGHTGVLTGFVVTTVPPTPWSPIYRCSGVTREC